MEENTIYHSTPTLQVSRMVFCFISTCVTELSINLSIIYLVILLSIHLSLHLFICLSIHPFIQKWLATIFKFVSQVFWSISLSINYPSSSSFHPSIRHACFWMWEHLEKIYARNGRKRQAPHNRHRFKPRTSGRWGTRVGPWDTLLVTKRSKQMMAGWIIQPIRYACKMPTIECSSVLFQNMELNH